MDIHRDFGAQEQTMKKVSTSVLSVQYELPLNDWHAISCAPRTTIDIEAWNGKEIRIVHFAQDLSGEEQPPFSGWFYPVKDAKDRVLYFSQFEHPQRWRPL